MGGRKCGANPDNVVAGTQSEKNDLKDVPNIKDFPDVFPRGFAGSFLRLDKLDIFTIDLVPGAAACSTGRVSLEDRPKGQVYHQLRIREEDTRRLPSRLDMDIMKSKTACKQEHEEHLKIILELLKKEELYAKFSKCEFWIPKVQFLGHVIDTTRHPVDPAKIEIRLKIGHTLLKTTTDIRQQFLGLASIIDDSLKAWIYRSKSLNAQTEAGKPEEHQERGCWSKLIENANFPEAIRTPPPPEKWNRRTDGTYCLNGRSWLPCYGGDLRTVSITSPTNQSILTIQSEKMLSRRKELYWWPNIKATSPHIWLAVLDLAKVKAATK
ncbi:hypothetical protein Tco_1045274 [Tanacetum coccineum]|uniref:Reverse transcriptase domain-containing protein n=1 Tax=Tanacetum coccineum TaxID=301880 RepID=A0ABQ5GST6_9ASTR